VVVSLPPKRKKVITICDAPNGKILVLKNMSREEIITSEIQKEIKKVSLPDDWASWMLAENRKDILSEAQSSTLFADNTKADISLLDSKIEKLMNAYLENAFRSKNIEI
jgi:hypothetical protein